MLLGSDGNEAPSVSFFKGKTVGIGVKNDTYQGNIQQKVSYHFPATGAAPASAEKAAPLNDEIPF